MEDRIGLSIIRLEVEDTACVIKIFPLIKHIII